MARETGMDIIEILHKLSFLWKLLKEKTTGTWTWSFWINTSSNTCRSEMNYFVSQKTIHFHKGNKSSSPLTANILQMMKYKENITIVID